MFVSTAILSFFLSGMAEGIHVNIFRPLNVREIKEEAKDILYMDEINNECTLLCPPPKQVNITGYPIHGWNQQWRSKEGWFGSGNVLSPYSKSIKRAGVPRKSVCKPFAIKHFLLVSWPPQRHVPFFMDKRSILIVHKG